MRNWRLPGRERLGRWLHLSQEFRTRLNNGILWLADEDIAIYTSADNYIESTILNTGTYEDEINKLIRISVRPGNVALDIGANIGLQSIRMSQSAGDNGRVYSFEPLNHLQEKFLRNVQLNKCNNINLMPFALSNTEKEADFVINKSTWNQGTFSIGASQTGSDKQRVIVKIADDVAEIKMLERLDLVKIDVEGFEFHVLRGLRQTLGKHRPRIIFEYDRNYWQAAGARMEDCSVFLTELNYRVYQIFPGGCELLTDPRAAESGNLFCIPS